PRPAGPPPGGYAAPTSPPPARPPYGPPPSSPPPAYGAPAGGEPAGGAPAAPPFRGPGAPAPPRRRSRLPWILVGVAVLILLVIVGLCGLLVLGVAVSSGSGDEEATPTEGAARPSAPAAGA